MAQLQTTGVTGSLFISGSIGVGTTSPSARIDIYGTAEARYLEVNAIAGFAGLTSGSAAMVELLNAGDGNTLFIRTQNSARNDAAPLAVWTNNNPRLLVRNDGLVGIGTNSPSFRLQVNHGTGAQYVSSFRNISDNLQIKIGTTTGGYNNIQSTTVSGDTAYVLSLQADGGNVGIGITSPVAKLAINTPNAYDGTILQLQSRDEPTAYNLKINEVVTSGVVRWSFDMTNSSAYNNVLVFDRGNIGIGITNPTHLLSLNRATEAAAYQLNINSAGGISDGNFTGIRFSQGSDASTELGNIKLHYYSTGATDLSFGTRYDTQAIYIKNGGNVGIGITNPGGLLTINGTNTPQLVLAGTWSGNHDIVFAGGSGNSTGGATNTSARIRNVSSAPGGAAVGTLTFTVNRGDSLVDAIYIKEDGNVGMGTASPTGKLNLTSTGGDGTAILRISGSASDTFNWASSTLHSNLTGGETSVHLIGKAQSAYNQAYIGYRHVSDGSTGNMLTLGMYASNYLMNITARGDVGIGTTSPYGGTGVRALDINASSYPVLALSVGGVYKGGLIGYSNHLAVHATTNSYITFEPNDSEAVRITSTGNVGIGSNNPGTKLDVNGEVYVSPNTAGKNTFTLTTNASNDGRLLIKSDTTNKVDIQANGITYFNGGNVGIGLTNPSTRLQVFTSNSLIADFTSAAQDGLTYLRVNNNQQTTSGGTSPAAIELVGLRGTSTHGRHAYIGAEGVDGTTFRTQIKFKIRNETAAYQWSDMDTQMVIDGNGSVGIGTTSPTAKLDIRSGGLDTNPLTIYGTTSGAKMFDFRDDSAGGVTAAMFRMYNASGTETVRLFPGTTTSHHSWILPTGNFGIGTTSPAYKLDVSSDIRIGEGLTMRSNEGSLYSVDGALSYYSSTNGVYLNGAGTNGWLRLNASGVENYNNCIDIYGGAAGAYMIFRTNNSERMRITSGGNVGIGTASPVSKLNISDGVSMYAAATGEMLQIKRNTTNGSDSSRVQITLANNSNSFAIVYGGTTDRLRFIDGGDVEVLSLVNGGNVGIGTTSPDNPLEVFGADSGIKISSLSANRPYLRFECGTSENLTLSANNTYGAIGYSGDVNVMVFRTGNVGIGTTDPQNKLQVAGGVTATSFVGPLTGNATTATSASKVLITYETQPDQGARFYVPFYETLPTGHKDLVTDGRMVYLTDNGTLYAPIFSGSFVGTISNATSASFAPNFANQNLTFNNSRTHNLDGNNLTFTATEDESIIFNHSSGGTFEINGSPTIQTTGTIQHTGAAYFTGNVGIGTTTTNVHRLDVGGTARIQTISQAASATDRFLVSDSGVVKYRTAAELASEINSLTQTFTFPATSGTAQWVRLGTWTAGQGGNVITVHIAQHNGYNAASNQNQEVFIYMKTSNGSSVDANGFAGDSTFWTEGLSSAISPGDVLWEANAAGVSATTFTLFILAGAFTNNSQYTVTTKGGTWGHIGSLTSPTSTSPSSTILLSERRFVANNVLTVDSSNVGIGSSSPAYKLDVNGTAAFQDNVTISSTKYLFTNNISANTNFANLLITGPTNANIILNGSNVGIGLTNPFSTLHVRSATNEGTIAVGNAIYPGLLYSNAGTGEFRLDNRSSSAAGYITFFPNGQNATLGTEAMRITTSGNIGIGTTSATSRLRIVGANTSTVPIIDVVASGTGTFQRGIRLLNGGMNAGDHIMVSTGYADGARNMGQFYFYFAGAGSTSNRLSLGLHSVDDVLNITGGGDVGIGITNPSTKLHVAGTGYFSSTLQTDGNLYVSNNGGRLYFDRPNGSTVGAVGWHTDDFFYVAGHPDYGPAAGNDVRVYGFGSYLHLGNSAAGDVVSIGTAGNVGISTNVPGFKLHVNGNAAFATNSGGLRIDAYDANTGNIRPTVANGSVLISDDSGALTRGTEFLNGGGIIVQSLTNFDPLSVLSNSTSVLHVKSGGNIGIGTTGPGANLDIKGAADTAGLIALQLRAGNSSANFSSNQITFGYGNSQDYRHAIKTRHHSNDYVNAIDFYVWKYATDNAGDIGTQHVMTIIQGGAASADTGRVGIGVTNPTSKLHVNGFARASGFSVNQTGGTVSGFIGYEKSWLGTGSSNSLAIASEGSNDLIFYTNGSTTRRMIITTGGNVGIGTDSPSYKLHVVGNFYSTTTGQFGNSYIDGTQSGWAIFGSNSTINGIKIVLDGNVARNDLTVNTSGYVGIGTSNATSRFHVYGDALDNIGLATFTNTYASGDVYYPAASFSNVRGNHSFGVVAEFKTETEGDSDRPSLLFFGKQVAASWQVGQGSTQWVEADSFAIGYRASNSPGTFTAWPTPYMVIGKAGNVGIGSTAPARKLDVVEGNVQIIANFSNTSTTSARIKFTDANTGAENVNIGAIGTRMAMWTNNTERMSIISGGNVGIATSAPAAKLHVNGTLRVDDTGTGPASTEGSPLEAYVGSDTYQLGRPADWLAINVNGTPYVIPLYTPGA